MQPSKKKNTMSAVGLFAGIGGLELGLSGVATARLFCEINPFALAVLESKFRKPGNVSRVKFEKDVKGLKSIPNVDVVAAGFPCQDLSMAGAKVGIGGDRSGLVSHLFSLLKGSGPEWLVIENVPYMLHLDSGRAMNYLTTELEELGYRWAYRVVDARAFGIPQRRLRMLLVASRKHDPRSVLFADDAVPGFDDTIGPVDRNVAYGFYWTEGKRGLGWATDAVPTIKGGSTVGIPSPPAVWVPATGMVGTPDIRDLERLQGFPENWTEATQLVDSGRPGSSARWNLVGNAVCVRVAEWLASRLASPGEPLQPGKKVIISALPRWPHSAWGEKGKTYRLEISTWPRALPGPGLKGFLKYPLKPLSARASEGYLSRTAQSKHLRFADGFLDDIRSHMVRMRELEATKRLKERPKAA